MKYTKSAILDSFDFIKRIIYIFELIIQLLYIGYLSYKIISNNGILAINIILLVLTVYYLVYYIATTREFYTHEQKVNKKTVKLCIKISKRIVNAIVIVISIYQLVLNSSANDNINMLMTLMMIFGYVLSIIGDIIVGLINNKIVIIINAVKYDLDELRNNHYKLAGIANFITNKFDIDIKSIPLDVDKTMLAKIKKVNYRQEQKTRRYKDFKKSKL